MIPDSVVDEVRARADIVDVIGEHVSLKRSGKEFKALCPFHDERTPSFYVVPDKGFYKCFGCDVSGDVFSFVMQRLGLDFVDAVKHVGQRAGMEVKEVGGRSPEDDPLRPLWEVNAFARQFYRERLEDTEGGAGARAYLEERGIDAESAERFGLGYAPEEWRALRDGAVRHGYEDDVLLEVGLLTTSPKSPEPYDRFRHRIVFPIDLPGGKVAGFGGRVMPGEGDDVPKYVNSPESPIYRKGEVLYGLSWARNVIRREEAALVVEGYMDAVSLGAAGLENVVAPLGTSLTPEQAALLSRFTTRVYLLFDSDAAGLRATFRAADVLLAEGLHPSVVTLPPGEDPDTLVRKEGVDALREYLDGAVDVLDRKLGILEEHDYFSGIERIRDAVDRLLPTLRAAADPALRDIYVSKVAERTGVRRETLEAQVQEGPRTGRGGRAPARAGGPRGDRDRAPERGSGTGTRRRSPAAQHRLPRMGAERKLLLLMVRDRRWIDRAGERVGPDDFLDPAYREVYRALIDDPGLASPPTDMDPVAARRLEEILGDPEELSQSERVFEESVSRIRGVALDRALEELDRRISGAGDEAERLALLEEKAKLGRERRAMGMDWSASVRRGLRREGRDRE